MKHVSHLKEGDRFRDPELTEVVEVVEVTREHPYWIVYGETETDPEVALVYGDDHMIELEP